MRRTRVFLLVFCCSFALAQEKSRVPTKTFQAWVSDAKCARGRASSGIYTGTNPRCAKECVEGGAKIVLILPKERKVLDIANPDAARGNIGNLVEVVGTTDAQIKTVHIASLKLVEGGVATCARPKLKQ